MYIYKYKLYFLKSIENKKKIQLQFEYSFCISVISDVLSMNDNDMISNKTFARINKHVHVHSDYEILNALYNT